MGNEDYTIPLLFGLKIVLNGWKIMGSIGALMFAGRWLVQFIYTRRAGRPVTPTLFWVMSMIGSSLLLIYFIFSPKQDMVGVLSNLFPGVVSAYNLYLEIKIRARQNLAAAQAAPVMNKPLILPEQAAGE